VKEKHSMLLPSSGS